MFRLMALCLISISMSFVGKNNLPPPTEVRSASLFPDRISLLRRVNLPSRVSLLKQLPPPYIPPPNHRRSPNCPIAAIMKAMRISWMTGMAICRMTVMQRITGRIGKNGMQKGSMHMNDRKMVLDGMMGLVVGDALGCPVQFLDREELRERGSQQNGGLRHL